MKKILIIAYYYPPVAGGGVQRTSKFAKYLPQFGWEPHVLTARNAYDYYDDPSLRKDIVRGIHVHRTPAVEPMKWVRKWMKSVSHKRSVSSGNSLVVQGGIKKRPWMLKLKESVFIPDGEIGWLPFAVWRGLRIIRKEKIDLIFSTSSPYTDHLIGCLLKKWTGRPWIADFRDPWSLHLKAPQFSWRKMMDKKLEKLVLSRADRIVTVTRAIEEDFKRMVPSASYRTIPNGYDEEDFAGLDAQKHRIDKFNVTYTGILFKENSPNQFLLAIQKLISQTPSLKDRIVIRFVGQMDNPGETDNYRFAANLNLSRMIEFIPYVSHPESLQFALSADVLLLIVNDGPKREGIMTGKIFEYLRCGKPVLAVVPVNGVAAGVVRETNSGIVVNPRSVDEIKDAILFMYRCHQGNRLNGLFPRKGIGQYDRYELTGMLTRECNSLVV